MTRHCVTTKRRCTGRRTATASTPRWSAGTWRSSALRRNSNAAKPISYGAGARRDRSRETRSRVSRSLAVSISLGVYHAAINTNTDAASSGRTPARRCRRAVQTPSCRGVLAQYRPYPVALRMRCRFERPSTPEFSTKRRRTRRTRSTSTYKDEPAAGADRINRTHAHSAPRSSPATLRFPGSNRRASRPNFARCRPLPVRARRNRADIGRGIDQITRAITQELGAANKRDACVQRPDHHKVVATRHAQPCADGAFTPFEFPDNFR